LQGGRLHYACVHGLGHGLGAAAAPRGGSISLEHAASLCGRSLQPGWCNAGLTMEVVDTRVAEAGAATAPGEEPRLGLSCEGLQAGPCGDVFGEAMMFASCHSVALSNAACASLPAEADRKSCLGGVLGEASLQARSYSAELNACSAHATDALLRTQPCQVSDAGIGCCGDGFCEWAESSMCPADCPLTQHWPRQPPPPPPPSPSPPPPIAAGLKWSKMINATDGSGYRRAMLIGTVAGAMPS